MDFEPILGLVEVVGHFIFSTNISSNSFVNMSSTQTTTQVINGRTIKKEVIVNNGQKKETTWVDGVKLEEGQNIQKLSTIN